MPKPAIRLTTATMPRFEPGTKIRIVTDKEYRIMSPPRKPRGEKPATTIRYLKRQIANLQASCVLHRNISEDREKVIAGYDVQLDETNRELERTQSTVADQAWLIGDLEQRLRRSSERLAYLEGYYAKSQETVSKISPIRTASSLVTSDQPETQAGGRPRDPEGLSAGRQRSQGAGLDQGAAGARSRLGDPLWRQQAHDSADTQGRPMEHIEINDGISREGFSLRD